MCLYHRRPEMKQTILDLCFAEARQGHVDLALLRLEDLLQDFGRDSQILYEKALITWEFLGRGRETGDQFRQAYAADPCHAYAAQNASYLAEDAQAFREWVEIARMISPRHDPWVSRVPNILSELDQGASYQELLIDAAHHHQEAKRFGKAAAAAELALLAGELPPDREANLRWGRAHSLRALDREAHQAQEARFEAFPPEERLTLQEAVRELERAQELDPYMPELRNLRAAWLILLGRYEEAVASTEAAIQLRPHLYAGPHINKAQALLNLGRIGEAQLAAQEALKQAQASGVPVDLEQASFFVRKTQNPTVHQTRDYEQHIRSWGRLSSREVTEVLSHRKLSLSRYGREVLARFHSLSPLNQGAILLMAELLSGGDRDILAEVSKNIHKSETEVRQAMVSAALTLTVHTNGVLPRDAARFLVAVLLEDPELPAIRLAYRSLILAPAAAGSPAWAWLPERMERELARLQPDLPGLIARQDPPDEVEKEQARRSILKDFKEIPTVPEWLETRAKLGNLLSRQMSRLDHCLSRLRQALDEARKDGAKAVVLKDGEALFQKLAGSPGDGALEVYRQLPGDLTVVENFLAAWKPGEAPGAYKIFKSAEKIREELLELQRLVDNRPPEVFEEIVKDLMGPRSVIRPFQERGFTESQIPGEPSSSSKPPYPPRPGSGPDRRGEMPLDNRSSTLGWLACLLTLALLLSARFFSIFTLSWFLTILASLGLSIVIGTSLANLIKRNPKDR
jgi:tetratricopeptide (TPR) repeat protein